MTKKNNLVCGAVAYEAPAVRVIDVVSEGVLCASGVDINDWEKDDDILEF